MTYKTLPKKELRALLAGTTDILTDLVAEDAKQYTDVLCPWCKKGKGVKEVNYSQLFTNDSLFPKADLRCSMCNCLWSPFTGMVIEIGNVG